MKKIIYLMSGCFFMCQSAQAMENPAFELFEDDEGFKAVYISKVGDEFNSQKEDFLKNPDSAKVQQIYFSEEVPHEEQVTIFDNLCNALNLVHVGNSHTEGFLENASTNNTMVEFLKLNKPQPSRTFRDRTTLKLENLTTQEMNYLPFLSEIVGDVKNVHSIHLTLSDLKPQMIKPLSLLLSQADNIQSICFEERFFSKGDSNIKNILPELLLMPKKLVYHFEIDSLAQVSTDFLNSQLDNVPLAKLQEAHPKKVVSLVGNYVGNSRNNFKMKAYNQVCESNKYHSIFKASYVDYVNEYEQKRHLQEMLKLGNSNDLNGQKKEMDNILRKEDSSYKALSIYKNKFMKIKRTLDKQDGTADARQQYLEDKKIRLINEMIDRLG